MSTDHRRAQPGRGRAALARACCAAVTFVAVVAGCSETGTPVADPEAPTAPHAAPPAPAPPAESGPLAGFGDFAASLPADVGLAVTPIGGGQTLAGGAWADGPAWSTMKVAIAIAAVDAGTARTDDLDAAIRRSDNDAADRLWSSLGPPDRAAEATGAVLARDGDPQTRVNAVATRPGFSAFGQTMWPLTAQSQFASHLVCDPAAAPVTDLMRSTDESWGLATVPGAIAKSGWGPDEDGRQLARQFGALPTPAGGLVAVAIAAQPDSGTFEDAAATLTTITQWLAPRLPAGTGCTP
ncbi:hypothetical protein [Rhodococcus rhodnii]|nr:hypothetical protein [Rhodococcus rhodnii]